MLSYQWRGTWVTSQVQLIGIDEKTQSQVSDFAKYLQHPANRQEMSFDSATGRLRHPRSPGRRPDAASATEMRRAGWDNRRRMARELRPSRSESLKSCRARPAGERLDGPPGRAVCPAASRRPTRSTAQPAPNAVKTFDPSKEQHTGRRAGHRHGQLPQGRRRGALPRLAGRRREAHLPHGRHAAQGRRATSSRSSISTKAR